MKRSRTHLFWHGYKHHIPMKCSRSNYNHDNKNNNNIIIHNIIFNTIIFIIPTTFCVGTKNYFHRYCVHYYYANYDH